MLFRSDFESNDVAPRLVVVVVVVAVVVVAALVGMMMMMMIVCNDVSIHVGVESIL